ncbi:DNA glycosylase [Vespertiliibacter pulmonis]|uniref:G/U mismatch-specific uracil-DNA glycosylase n=1 Tax=Vespertiliibacter pulmonis TaxID=1443036 RepID=A0A3N4WM35_9PAST|nr:DNA glycosylase [Vespertiliibacter pulmonis]QLB20209.1 DNA glycosylase [Vespertiliibacter pulmonis]RPE86184.1 G/U mismatch-specific uracil-DNA glycosylase [Vespertiliibacter pulmonis]
MSEFIEEHPFPPLLPPNTTVMMMGTFPPAAEKRCMNFYYPNFQNDMWRIYGEIFFSNPLHFQIKDEKQFDSAKISQFIQQKGIALCPTVNKAIREHNNASDKYLKVVEAVNLNTILPQIPNCQWLFTTGGKATDILLNMLPTKTKAPKTNEWIDYHYNNFQLKLYRLPSTSRAYPLSFSKKVEAYRQFFLLSGIL